MARRRCSSPAGHGAAALEAGEVWSLGALARSPMRRAVLPATGRNSLGSL